MKLIPKLQPNSIAIDNISDEVINRVPKSHSNKLEMMNWLTNNGIPFSSGIPKSTLHEKVSKYKQFKITSLLEKYNYTVLHLPPP